MTETEFIVKTLITELSKVEKRNLHEQASVISVKEGIVTKVNKVKETVKTCETMCTWYVVSEDSKNNIVMMQCVNFKT